MQKMCKKLSDACKIIFGYGILLSLFGGGMTLLGYIAAFIVGGELATEICVFIYKKFIPVVVYISTSMVLLGIVSMYLAGEYALTAKRERANIRKKRKSEI